MFFRKRARKLKGTDCTAVIAAAGASERMNGVDKQLADINGIPVIIHTLRAFEAVPSVNEIIIVTQKDKLETISRLCAEHKVKKVTSVVAGGETRLDSVINGVFAASKKAGLIAVHDGARPCVTGELITRAIKCAVKHHAAAPAVPVTSTLKLVKNSVIEKTVDRDGLYEIQTPQVFKTDIIKAALTNAKKTGLTVTDDCRAAEALGVRVHITEGSRENIKITTPQDLIPAGIFLRQEAGNE